MAGNGRRHWPARYPPPERTTDMEELKALMDHIVRQVRVSLREFDFDLDAYVQNVLPLERMVRFYGFYGITSHHPIHFDFRHSSLAGSYFLGKCRVENSIVYKCDIRGDELKEKGGSLEVGDNVITLYNDEMIEIRNSLLFKTLVHNYSHDPESADRFYIHNTVAKSYSNIHGSPLNGCFLGPFATVDLTTIHDCVIGTYAYVQSGYLSHKRIPPGHIWVEAPGAFNFQYQHDEELLKNYIYATPHGIPTGRFMDFAENKKIDFQKIFDSVHRETPTQVPAGASINRYSVFKGESQIRENVLVAQRAFVESSYLGKSANAQENCYIMNSHLEGFDVMAHGATIIGGHLERQVFVGFNSFLMADPKHPLRIGSGSIVMPHTIMDLTESIEIPPETLVWGFIQTPQDLAENSLPLSELKKVNGHLAIGRMEFNGSGVKFVNAFQHRIEHILEANGAYFDGKHGRGHAQKGQNISFNIIQPYPRGPREGLYPSIEINP